MIACNAASNSGTWCCAYDGNCCSASTFVPTFGTIFAEPGASTAAAPTGTTNIPTLGSSTTTLSSSSTGASTSSTATGAAASSTQTPGALTSKPNTIATGTIVAAILSVVLGLAAIAGFGLFVMERKKRLRLEAERPVQTPPEVKVESSHASEHKATDVHHVSAMNEWSQSDVSRPRHELSTQSYVTPELPTGIYGR